MACGTPVITSNVSALPEIVGDSAILIDPYNMSELIEAMNVLYYNLELRKKLSKKGLIHCKKFTWDTSAKAHDAIFEQFI